MKKTYKLQTYFGLLILFSVGVIVGHYGYEFFENSKKKDESMLFLDQMYDAYNKKNLDEYCSFFDTEINVFKEHGRGNVRIISGKEELKGFYQNVFQKKKNLKLTSITYFSVHPWVLVEELIETDKEVFTAAVGYRIQNGKILDKMILSEKFVINKETIQFTTK